MKNYLIKYKNQIISYLIAVSLGVLFHFLYDWLNNPIFLGPFLAIDESVFEHLKLLFYPIFIVSIIEGVILNKDLPTFISSRVIGVISSSIMLVILYYINWFLNNGKAIDIISIISYFVFMITTYVISENMEEEYKGNKYFIYVSLGIMFIYIAFLTFFTYYKPDIDFFVLK